MPGKADTLIRLKIQIIQIFLIIVWECLSGAVFVCVTPRCGAVSNLNSNSILHSACSAFLLLATKSQVPRLTWTYRVDWTAAWLPSSYAPPSEIEFGALLPSPIIIPVQKKICSRKSYKCPTSVCDSCVAHASFSQTHHHTCENLSQSLHTHLVLLSYL